MKGILVLLLLFCSIQTLRGQNAEKQLDLIIMIDDKVSEAISGVKVIVTNGDSSKELTPRYYPGNLSLSESEFNLLVDNNTKTIYLQFNVAAHKPIDSYKVYKIEFKKQWLSDYYNIIKIYNLDNKKYWGQFDKPKNGEKYVYELSSSSHSFLIIRKKHQN